MCNEKELGKVIVESNNQKNNKFVKATSVNFAKSE
jgi:hypothetical protein